MAKKKSNSNLISAILYILIGALLIIFRSQTLGWAMTVAGIFFVVSGIIELVKKNWAGGIVSLVIGAAILILGWLATAIVLLVLGILIALKGIVDLINVIKGKVTVMGLLFPILTIVLGLALAFGNGLDIIIIVVGVLLVIDGVLGLLASFKK